MTTLEAKEADAAFVVEPGSYSAVVMLSDDHEKQVIYALPITVGDADVQRIVLPAPASDSVAPVSSDDL